jgi:hypothetical protein
MKRLVTMRFIRIKRRGLAQVREKYRVAYENYLVQVAHWEQMLAARHISNKHGDDHDVPKVRIGISSRTAANQMQTVCVPLAAC